MTHRGVWQALKAVRVSIISRGWKAWETGSWPNHAKSSSTSLLVTAEKLITLIRRLHMCVCLCVRLTPLCEGHSEVLRWLAEGPELGISPFSRGLMESVLSVVRSSRFEILCRSTKGGLSAPFLSLWSSLKRWTSHCDEKFLVANLSRIVKVEGVRTVLDGMTFTLVKNPPL